MSEQSDPRIPAPGTEAAGGDNNSSGNDATENEVLIQHRPRSARSNRSDAQGDVQQDAEEHVDINGRRFGEENYIAPPKNVKVELRAAAFGKNVGGLLNEDGDDVRARHKVEEEEIEDEEIRKQEMRRQSSWRGRSAAKDAGIQYDFALNTFDNKIQAMVLSSDLKLYIIFIVMFCFFFLVGRNVTDNNYFVVAIRDPITTSEWNPAIMMPKAWGDVNGAADWSQFMMYIFAPQMLGAPPVIGPNYLIGNARVRTLRVRPNTCDINPSIVPQSMPAAAQECFGPWATKNEDDGTLVNRYNEEIKWKFRSCEEMNGGTRTTGIISTYHCGGYSFYVPFWQENDGSIPEMPFRATTAYRLTTQDEAQNVYLSPMLYNTPNFVDNTATRFAALEYFVYSPELDTFLSAKFFAEVAQGGLWKAQHQVRVFEVWTKKQVGKTVYDFFFFAFVLYYLYDFLHDLIRFRRKEGKTLAFFFDTWNFLEIVNLSIFVAVFAFRWTWWGTCMSTDLSLEKIIFPQRYPVELEDILAYYMLQVYLNSVNTTLVFLKLLKFLRLNARLNILSRTLAESQDSIIGVLFIFFLIVTAFAMTGHGLFGLGIWSYRSIDASFSTLALILLGQFDYESMKNENRVLAGFFFWGYIILALFCLLNFLIGVLTEAFSAVSATQSILPLEEVLSQTWREWLYQFHPVVLKNQIIQNLKGNSREFLLQDALDHIAEHRKLLYPEDGIDVPDPDKQLLHKREVWEAIPAKLMDQIGEKYFEYIWDDLVYEFDRSNLADEAIEAQRNLDATTKGVQAAIGNHLELIETFAPRMQELERNLNNLVSILESRH